MSLYPTPPQQFIDAVAGVPITAQAHFEIGKHLHDLVRQRCGVRLVDFILDIGSGCGRVAGHFMGSIQGEYHGLDIVLPMVDWCRANISTRDPHFHFHHAELSNTLYQGGSGDAANYVFPFDDATFDVIFATSVFTHLLPASARQYARQISRVLKPGSCALLTFFLINDPWRQKILSGQKMDVEFPYEYGRYRTAVRDSPESAIAYEQQEATLILEEAGLRIKEISLGWWSKNLGGWTAQDVILLEK
jgi:SAM-dependent methyltransferase